MRVLRRIFRPKREIERCKKKPHNEELVLLSRYYLDYQMG